MQIWIIGRAIRSAHYYQELITLAIINKLLCSKVLLLANLVITDQFTKVASANLLFYLDFLYANANAFFAKHTNPPVLYLQSFLLYGTQDILLWLS